MSRALTSGVVTALLSGNVKLEVYCFLDWPSGAQRVWTGLGDSTWGGNTYIGLGQMGKVSAVAESSDGRANGITLTVSGVPTEMVAIVLNDKYRGRASKLWLGFLDTNDAVIPDPYQLFRGRMDVATIDKGPETSTINLTVENRMIDMQRSRSRRYTQEDQQIDYPGDRGFEFVAGLQDKNIVWGKAVTSPVVAPATAATSTNIVNFKVRR